VRVSVSTRDFYIICKIIKESCGLDPTINSIHVWLIGLIVSDVASIEATEVKK